MDTVPKSSREEYKDSTKDIALIKYLMEKSAVEILKAFSKVDPYTISEKSPAKLYNLGISSNNLLS